MPQPQEPARQPFIHRESVRWNDLDCQGVLNNAIFLTLFEQARYGYFKSLDLIPPTDRFPFFLGETSVRFLRPGRAGMQLDIEAEVTRLGTKSFDMVSIVRHGLDEIATGTATLIWIDTAQKSCRIPDSVRQLIIGREPKLGANSCE